jgi:DmsE family decaheme c-type cytochrome
MMTKLSRIKQLMVRALQCATLGTALLSGAAYAADAPKDLVLNGDAKCTACHDESDSPGVLAIGKTRHGVRADGRTPSCTSCHGDSAAHIGYKGSAKPPAPDRTFGKKSKNTAAEKNVACLTCHENDNKRHNWDGSAHANNDVSCSSCHETHTGHDKVRDKRTQAEVCFACHKEQRADSKKMSHHAIGEGKVVCSDCHNPHGSTGPKMLKKNTINETCFSCHAEKRGPFLWDHQPAAEDCSNCHTAHGSNMAPLLKARPNFLCQQCHNGAHQSTGNVGPIAGGYQGGLTVTNAANPGTNTSPGVGVTGKACINCHTMIHGSNSPTGAWLHR